MRPPCEATMASHKASPSPAPPDLRLRQFSLVFGTSELAVAAVLAAYMGGLSLGAAVAARYVHSITRPVLLYGLLEAGIALSALAVPLLLQLARMVYVAMLGGQPEPVDASGLGQSFTLKNHRTVRPMQKSNIRTRMYVTH